MARGGRGKVVPGTASLISVTAGNRKNKEIPIRHSNKLCTNNAVLLYMGEWMGEVLYVPLLYYCSTAVRGGCE